MTDHQLTEQFEKFKRDDDSDYGPITHFGYFQAGYLLGLGKLDELKEMIKSELKTIESRIGAGKSIVDTTILAKAFVTFEKVLKMIEQIKKESEKG